MYDKAFIFWLVGILYDGLINYSDYNDGYFTHSIDFLMHDVVTLEELHWYYLFELKLNQ